MMFFLLFIALILYLFYKLLFVPALKYSTWLDQQEDYKKELEEQKQQQSTQKRTRSK